MRCGLDVTHVLHFAQVWARTTERLENEVEKLVHAGFKWVEDSNVAWV